MRSLPRDLHQNPNPAHSIPCESKMVHNHSGTTGNFQYVVDSLPSETNPFHQFPIAIVNSNRLITACSSQINSTSWLPGEEKFAGAMGLIEDKNLLQRVGTNPSEKDTILAMVSIVNKGKKELRKFKQEYRKTASTLTKIVSLAFLRTNSNHKKVKGQAHLFIRHYRIQRCQSARED